LASEKNTKDYILDETKSSEAEYQRLLAQAKKEQQTAASDIVNLEKVVRDKINQQGSGLNIPLTYDGFIWPVPKNTITAYFHDPSYPFRYVFEHPAIDIRASQGTPVKAAASGYVGRAHDGGMGYSYIMLVHADGLATVYGHVSRIYVKNDEYVTQGQIIGLSGAMPGTPGAGPLTTGPHLHFEVRLNGIPVNPLEYLQ
jgi:murein DD-endopeptidase MepM/ murein hydrolase activator NlpD